MTNLVSIASMPRKLDTENIEFYDDLFKADNEQGTLEFTETGRAYYGSWFRRYGFKFEGITALEFFATVRDINRLLWDEEPIEQQVANGTLQGEEAEVWTLWVQGRFDEFSQAFTAMAERAKANSHERVISFKRAAPAADQKR